MKAPRLGADWEQTQREKCFLTDDAEDVDESGDGEVGDGKINDDQVPHRVKRLKGENEIEIYHRKLQDR